ncbi:MAG: CbiX/SirB N-terminal domain-containing protein [Pirellulales bacterium]
MLTAALREFAARRATQAGCAVVLGGFVVGQRPTLNEALRSAALSPQRTILVQPHLLFPGRVWNDIAQATRIVAAQTPEKRWFLAPPLGPDRQLAEMLAERVRAAIADHSSAR